MNILIFGDSHLGAMTGAFQTLRWGGYWPKDVTYTENRLGAADSMMLPYPELTPTGFRPVTSRTQKWVSHVPATSEPRPDVIVMSGPFHTMRFLRGHAFTQWAPYSDPKLAYVSPPVLRAGVRAEQVYNNQVVVHFLHLGYRVVVIEAAELFDTHPVFSERPPRLIRDVNRLYRQTVQDDLMALGAEVLRIPPDLLREDGWMDQKWRNPRPDDHHHVSQQFAQLTLARLLRHLLPDRDLSMLDTLPVPPRG